MWELRDTKNGLKLLAVATMSCGSAATAQMGPTFSVDFQGPTAGAAFDGFGSGVPITEGDILTTAVPGPPGPNPPALGPLPAPGIFIPPGVGGGPVPPGLGIFALTPFVELDALSYGRDELEQIVFSVDEWAVGIGGTPAFPNVASEGALGSLEAAADVFRYLGPAVATPVPAVIPSGVIGNTQIIDGNGVAPTGLPGLGLVEPNPPVTGIPDQGDNLDALDIDTFLANQFGPVFYSLDAAFADPLEAGPPPNTGSAIANGFVGGDVLVTTMPGAALPLGGPVIYAPAAALGLDFSATGGNVEDSDDLDALILRDDGALSAAKTPFFSPASDLLLFSVRRNSAIIGTPDSVLGIGIEEGDILAPPGTTIGGFVVPAAGLPGIFIPAEALGLATFRSGLFTTNFGDELDALDATIPEPASLVLFGIGAGLLIGRRRRRA